MKATKLTANAQYHVTCEQGSPETKRNNILIPICLFNIKLFWATMTNKGSLY